MTRGKRTKGRTKKSQERNKESTRAIQDEKGTNTTVQKELRAKMIREEFGARSEKNTEEIQNSFFMSTTKSPFDCFVRPIARKNPVWIFGVLKIRYKFKLLIRGGFF